MAALCKPDCPYCHGNGWYRVDVPMGDPDFGKLMMCPNMDLRIVMKDKCGLTREEIEWTWEKIWDINNAVAASHIIETTLDRGYGWVVLWGEYGLAKTLLLKISVATALRSGKRAAYVRMSSIIDDLRAAYEQDDSAEARLAFWTNLPVLCVDEFDRMRETEYASERRFVLMDTRYEEALRRTQITIMAMNTNPETLPGYLADRVFDGRFDVIKLTGPSVRPALDWKEGG